MPVQLSLTVTERGQPRDVVLELVAVGLGKRHRVGFAVPFAAWFLDRRLMTVLTRPTVN